MTKKYQSGQNLQMILSDSKLKISFPARVLIDEINGIKGINAYFFALRGCVNELAASDVQSDMRYASGSFFREENEVAFLQILFIHGSAGVKLSFGVARKIQTV